MTNGAGLFELVKAPLHTRKWVLAMGMAVKVRSVPDLYKPPMQLEGGDMIILPDPGGLTIFVRA
jgi:hypothetical protein